MEITEEYQILKFLDDEPLANWSEHWVERKAGKRSWTCLKDDCPLCDMGDKPSPKSAFNVVRFTGEDAENGALVLRSQATSQLENLGKDEKMGPLTKHYWAVNKSRSGNKGTFVYNFNVVKERDLFEEWEIEPLNDTETEDLVTRAYTSEDIVRASTRAQMEELVEELIEGE